MLVEAFFAALSLILLWINKYKWFQLNLLLNDGTFYKKTFYKEKMQEQIIIVSFIRKEVYGHRLKSNFRNEKESGGDLVVQFQ